MNRKRQFYISYYLNISSAYLIFFRLSALAQSDNRYPVIDTKLGRYAGLSLRSREGNEYLSFLGIPYAFPPARFQPSRLSTEGWDGIREARVPGPKCPQAGWLGIGPIVGSEYDCLVLNVYVPKEGIATGREHLPVMVYIHEGLFSSGEGAGPEHGAKYFMDERIILVTINYRLGVFGFLNTGDREVTGNLGLKDQVVALQWVRENIESFGGDADKVTIFGNDAGAVSVSLLLLSPAANGLFSRAIAQSGSALVPWAWQAESVSNAKKLGQILNCSVISSRELVQCLRTKSANALVRAQLKFTKWFRDPIATFVPSMEVQTGENFLTQHPLSILANGNFSKVPLMIGIVEDEGLLHSAAIINDERRLTEINNEWFKFAPITLLYGDIKQNIIKSRISTTISQFYFGGKFIGEETLKNLTNLYTDRYFIRGIKLSALLHSRFSPVYPYLFSYKGEYSNLVKQGVLEVLGVSHTDELQYLFYDYSRPEFPPGSESERISKSLVRMWVSFAETGVPRDTRLFTRQQEWRPTQPEELEGRVPYKWYRIDSKARLINEPFTRRLQSWNILETAATSTVAGLNSNTPQSPNPIPNSPNRFVNSNGNRNIFTQLFQGISTAALQFLDVFGEILRGLQTPFVPISQQIYNTRYQYTPSNYNNYNG